MSNDSGREILPDIFKAIDSGDTENVQKILEQHEIDDESKCAILARVLSMDAPSMKIVTSLIDQIADFKQHTDSNSLLNQAINNLPESDKLQIVTSIIDKGAVYNPNDYKVQDYIHGNFELAEKFYTKNPSKIIDDDNPILIQANALGNTKLVKWLIDQGANLNAQNREKDTALHFAINSNNFALQELLINAGAATDIANIYHQTARDLMNQRQRPLLDQMFDNRKWMLEYNSKQHQQDSFNASIKNFAQILQDYYKTNPSSAENINKILNIDSGLSDKDMRQAIADKCNEFGKAENHPQNIEEFLGSIKTQIDTLPKDNPFTTYTQYLSANKYKTFEELNPDFIDPAFKQGLCFGIEAYRAHCVFTDNLIFEKKQAQVKINELLKMNPIPQDEVNKLGIYLSQRVGIEEKDKYSLEELQDACILRENPYTMNNFLQKMHEISTSTPPDINSPAAKEFFVKQNLFFEEVMQLHAIDLKPDTTMRGYKAQNVTMRLNDASPLDKDNVKVLGAYFITNNKTLLKAAQLLEPGNVLFIRGFRHSMSIYASRNSEGNTVICFADSTGQSIEISKNDLVSIPEKFDPFKQHYYNEYDGNNKLIRSFSPMLMCQQLVPVADKHSSKIAISDNKLTPEQQRTCAEVVHDFLPAQKFYTEYPHQINALNVKDDTPLNIAIRYNNTELAKWLIEQGADIHLEDKNGHSALRYAYAKNNPDIIKTIYTTHPEQMNIPLKNGMMPFMGAICYNPEVAQWMMEKDPQILNRPDNKGDHPLPLMNALNIYHESGGQSYKHLDLIEWIIDNHPEELQKSDKDGYTPLTELLSIYLASDSNAKQYWDMARRIVDKHPEVLTIQNSKGRTPLQEAMYHDDRAMVGLLIELRELRSSKHTVDERVQMDPHSKAAQVLEEHPEVKINPVIAQSHPSAPPANTEKTNIKQNTR